MPLIKIPEDPLNLQLYNYNKKSSPLTQKQL
jgi:hypothetical protein